MIQAGFPPNTEWGLDFIFSTEPQGTRQDGTLVVRVRITLKPGREDELIALVLSAKKLAPAIREAMRSRVVKGTYAQLELNPDDLTAVGIDLPRVTFPGRLGAMSHRSNGQENVRKPDSVVQNAKCLSTNSFYQFRKGFSDPYTNNRQNLARMSRCRGSGRNEF